MRLLHTSTLQLAEFFDSNTPPYAILSHTWGDEEISFPQMQNLTPEIKDLAGFRKVADVCRIVNACGYQYGWVDTCCIDKSSSAELSEAINSMYRYYRNAEECLIYLSDVPGIEEHGSSSRAQQLESFQTSRWFKRGWTLQELLASRKRTFFSADWVGIDDEGDLTKLVSHITSINITLLRNRDILSTFCTAERMSWAASRKTTRAEDRAYSLMGLFNINMPVLYGEGAQNAFRRLQEEILRTSFDQTIFVWRGYYESSGLLAKSLSDFKHTPRLGLWGPFHLSPSTMTNVGLCLRINVIKVTSKDRSWLPRVSENAYMGVIACDIWSEGSWQLLVLHLEPVPTASFYANGKICRAFRRVESNCWTSVALENLTGRTGPSKAEDVLILEDEHFELVARAWDDHQARRAGSLTNTGSLYSCTPMDIRYIEDDLKSM